MGPSSRLTLLKNLIRSVAYTLRWFLHILASPPFIDWIMRCITSASFSVLVNGSASHLFHVERGLRQGCPLSLLLFLIIMEGLSRLTAFAKRDGRLYGLKIYDQCFLTHLLFVDDVLIFLNGSIRDTYTFYEIVTLFAPFIGMEANHTKSTITLSNASPQEARFSQHKFPFQSHHMEDGLKYLGFRIKPHCCRIAEWIWLMVKIEKILQN